MITPAVVAKRIERIERERRLRKAIYQHSYPVNDCVIWLKNFSRANRTCWIDDYATGKRVDIKRLVTRTVVPCAQSPVWAVTCGHNRCIRAEHQRVVKFVPVRESESE